MCGHSMELPREEIVKEIARDVGFSLVGIASLESDVHANDAFARWLGAGMHGDMTYLERHRVLREDATLLLPGARSAVCVALNYYQDVERKQLEMDGRDGRGRFSVYVHGEDYHAVMERMLSELEARLKLAFPNAATRVCCDIQPISDRSMALRAGIAWLGKNTNVISPEYGSWIFLGEVLTDLEMQADEPLETLCGKCTRCIDACPTGALDTPFVLDARRCISYLTIEKRGEIDPELASKIGIDVYGCDTCQSVCPFNRVASESLVFFRGDRSPLVEMTLDELATISDEEFREKTRGSAIRRAKAEGMRRNAGLARVTR
ncbi:MAG TPA: tRNA epoxyqueuosine(34) reductase QueG [Candidatus Krumholzibacteria bacterium]|nr:tRNA epoxyqueuosine(34) reductase QueG [Candidatus Krumholzibacteria bacterium]